MLVDHAVRIRPATGSDLRAILSIYNDVVQKTTAIWNETLVDLSDREAWLADRNAKNFPGRWLLWSAAFSEDKSGRSIAQGVPLTTIR